MKNLHPYFDRRFGRASLNRALVLLVACSGDFTLGIVGMIKYAKIGDDVGFSVGVANTALGISGIFFGSQMIHAVVRRLIAEARNTP